MHRKDIDGLRAVAVIAVIVSHTDKALLPNGYLGVDVFYVISGFVITQSLLLRQHDSFGDYLLGFYRRRIKRLLPALFLCVAITMVCFTLVVPPDSPLAIPSLSTGIAALFGLSNIHLMTQATDYFGASAALNPFTHTWSLGVEEQFYLLFPLLLWWSGLLQKKTWGSKAFSWLIGVASGASLLLYLLQPSPVVAFYLMPLRFWELGLGSMAYLGLTAWEKHAQDPKVPPSRLYQVGMLLLLLALVAVFLLPQGASQGYSTLAVVMLTGALLPGIRQGSLAYKALTLRPLVYIGVISYSLYLWHWSVLTISRLTVGVSGWTIPFQLLAMALLAVLSYERVEMPLRHAEWGRWKIGRFQPREFGVALLLASGLAYATVVLLVPLHEAGYLYTGTSPRLIKKGVQSLLHRHSYKGHTWEGRRCVLRSNNDVGKVITPAHCTLGNFRTAKRRFLVIGDSFGAAELEMYKILVAQGRGSVTVTSSWGASAVPELENKTSQDKANRYYWGTVIPALLKKLRAGDVLLMLFHGIGFSPKQPTKATTRRLATLKQGLLRLSGELAKRGIFVIYQSSLPFMQESNCTPSSATSQWWNYFRSSPCTYYTKAASLKRRRTYHETLLSVQKERSNVAILDLFGLFCPGRVCTFFGKKGVYLYRDEWSHASVEASLLAQPILLRVVDRLLARAAGRKAQKRREARP